MDHADDNHHHHHHHDGAPPHEEEHHHDDDEDEDDDEATSASIEEDGRHRHSSTNVEESTSVSNNEDMMMKMEAQQHQQQQHEHQEHQHQEQEQNIMDVEADEESRKRPPSKQYCEENDQHQPPYQPPYQRPRIMSNLSNVQEAASGIIDLANRHHNRPPQAQDSGNSHSGSHHNLYYPPSTSATHTNTAPATATATAAAADDAITQNICAQNQYRRAAQHQHINNNRNNMIPNNQQFHNSNNSVVHLSIIKTKPSFTEPWRKFPPISFTGTGVVIAWNTEESTPTSTATCAAGGGNSNCTEKEGTSMSMPSSGQSPKRKTNNASHSQSMPNSPEGKRPSENTHGRQSDNNNNNNNNNSNNPNSSIRILTNAHAVQYVTSIRARTQHSPISVGCTVEYISLAMDLALLKINDTSTTASMMAPPLPVNVNTNLPYLGEEVTCRGFPTASNLPDLSSSSSMQNLLFTNGRYSNLMHNNNSQFSRHVESTTSRGIVAGFHAGEKEHGMLRMNMNLYTNGMGFGGNNNNNGSTSSLGSAVGAGGGGGVVMDGNGNVLGLIASSSTSVESTSTSSSCSVIPGLVIDQFLRLCHHNHHYHAAASLHAHSASTPCHHGTDGEEGTASHASAHETGDETSHSDLIEALFPSTDKGATTGHRHGKLSSNNNTKRLPGIPTLGITGYQTLENGALRRSLGLDDTIDYYCGVRILGISHTVHPAIDNHQTTSECKEDKKCHTSMLRTDDILLAIDDAPIRLDGTVRLAPGRDYERVDFRWLISQRAVGSRIKLEVVRHKKRMQLQATLSAPRYLVPKSDEEEDVVPSYLICGGCVFVPLTRAWLEEMAEKRQQQTSGYGRGNHCAAQLELHGFQRYLQEHRRENQQIIILSHVLPDEVNVGYHNMTNMVLSSVNGQRPIVNMQHLMDMLVKREKMDDKSSLEFRCSYVNLDRAKVVICMDAKEIMDSETRIMSNYAIEAFSSPNALSPALKKEAEGKAHRHGVTCGLKTMRALRNAVRETTLNVVRRRPAAAAAAAAGNDNSAVAATRRIMDFSETHKMQSAPLFAGKYTEEGGWTQVKTKHLSQLCTCGRSTRFYCICTVGVMRCKECFIQHCRDHTSQGHACSESCAPDCEKANEPAEAPVLAEGVELVTTKKRKRNNPTQAIQSRCVVCKAKTCYCCSACGFEKEVALCHVSTGRNCLPIHTSEHHQGSKVGASSCGHSHHSHGVDCTSK